MPQITAIESQKKQKARFNIYHDGKFAFGLSGQTLLENNLKIGQDLSLDTIQKIISKEDLSKLTDKTLRFLSVRPRSQKEVSDYLVKKIATQEKIKFNQARQSPLVEKILAKMKKYQYINDQEFARWLVKSRIRSNPRGPRALKIELSRYGVEKETIEKALSKFPNEVVIAEGAIQKKLKSWQKLSNLELKKKVYQYLASRGFDYEAIKDIFAQIAKKR